MQVTDTTTFTDEMKRAEVDSWLYETCTQCLQHMVDVFVQYYSAVSSLLTRILDLLSNFIRCKSLPAADGVCSQRLQTTVLLAPYASLPLSLTLRAVKHGLLPLALQLVRV